MKHPAVPRVFVPMALENSDYVGNVYGYYHVETGIYNILAWDPQSLAGFAHLPVVRIGSIVAVDGPVPDSSADLVGRRASTGLGFSVDDRDCDKELYELVQNIFSRNTGILETDWMLAKTAFIVGCGSVGSLVAVELARAGVGQFALVDNDILGYHNLCRHQCSLDQVGQYKALALKEKILGINPTARVTTYIGIAETLEKEVFDLHCGPGTVLIGCADNREADYYLSRQVASYYNTPFISVGFWERAFAGEVFYWIPTGPMPCYECAVGPQGNSVSARVSTNRRIYTTEEELLNVNFEPGISVDINFVTLVAVKLILDILNRDNPRFTPRVLQYLTQYTLVCNTNDPRIGGEMAEIFAHPLQITRSIKVGYRSPCPPCRHQTH